MRTWFAFLTLCLGLLCVLAPRPACAGYWEFTDASWDPDELPDASFPHGANSDGGAIWYYNPVGSYDWSIAGSSAPFAEAVNGMSSHGAVGTVALATEAIANVTTPWDEYSNLVQVVMQDSYTFNVAATWHGPGNQAGTDFYAYAEADVAVTMGGDGPGGSGGLAVVSNDGPLGAMASGEYYEATGEGPPETWYLSNGTGVGSDEDTHLIGSVAANGTTFSGSYDDVAVYAEAWAWAPTRNDPGGSMASFAIAELAVSILTDP